MEHKEDATAKRKVWAIVRNIEGKRLSHNEDEPGEPCWIFLSEICQQEHSLFKNMLILEGCDFRSNTYIIVGEYLTIVDPGYDHTVFKPLFQRPEYAPGDIQKIVLTHKPPHRPMGALELLRYPAVRSNPQLEFILHVDSPVETKRVIRQLGGHLTEVKGGEMLDLGGFDWKVVATPMYANDGISMYHSVTRTLISGDMVPPMTVYHKEAGEWVDKYLISMRLLMEFDIANVLPRHGLPIASSGKKVVEASYRAVLLKTLNSTFEGTPSWFEIASTAADKGFHRDALICCDMAMAVNQEQYGPLKLKACCFNELGEYEKALETFDLLEERFPHEEDGIFTILGRAHSYRGLKRYDEGRH